MKRAQIYQQIVLSYLKNGKFFFPSAIGIISYVLFILNKSPLSPWTQSWSKILLIAFLSGIHFIFINLWPYILGTILKNHFAHPRATVLPSFRITHLIVASLLYLGYLILIWLNFSSTINYVIPVSFYSIVAIWLGYRYGLNLFWVVIILFFYFKRKIPLELINWEVFQYTALTLFFILTFGLGWRLMRVREEPSGDLFGWFRIRKAAAKTNTQAPSRQCCRQITPYPTKGSFLSRTLHWKKYIFYNNFFKWSIGISMGAWALFTSLLSNSKTVIIAPFAILGTLLPVSIVWGKFFFKQTNPKRNDPFGGFNLLKPIERGTFLKEVGVAMFLETLEYWFIFLVCWVIIPLLIIKPLSLQREWLILSLSLQVFIWGIMSCYMFLRLKWRYLFFLAIFFWFNLFFFAVIFDFNSGFFDIYTITIISFSLVIAGILFARIGWRLWYGAEFG